jgi:hypothetical protein
LPPMKWPISRILRSSLLCVGASRALIFLLS